MRFVSVILCTGELEILVTSIMDETIEFNEFRWLYGKRWGVETFYSLVKGRLCLENFTGKTSEAVKQDFSSTIFISNLETLITQDAEEEINARLKEKCYAKKVNTTVSFNTIKNMAFELFMTEADPEKTLEKMTLVFKMNPGLERVGREPQKKNIRLTILQFSKKGQKACFLVIFP